MGMTVVEKILARASGLKSVKAGDVVEPKVDFAMSHENAALVMNQYLEIYQGTGLIPKLWDPSKIGIIFDHRVPAESPKTASNQKKIREFVAAKRIQLQSSTISGVMSAASVIKYYPKMAMCILAMLSWERIATRQVTARLARLLLESVRRKWQASGRSARF